MPHPFRLRILLPAAALLLGALTATAQTPEPAKRVEVTGQLKITGGNPGTGKVLTSDAEGLGSWRAPVTNTLVCAGRLPKQSAGQIEIALPAAVRPEAIVGITAVVPLTGGELVPPGYTAVSDRFYNVVVVDHTVRLSTTNNSWAVLDKDVRVLLTYQP